MSEHIETAARAEAERRWPVADDGSVSLTYPRDVLREFRRASFTAGVAWQAAQPRTVSAEQASAAAEVLWNHYGEDDPDQSQTALAVARDMLAALGITVAEAGEVR